MTNWYTSDHHFNHFNILSYCGRPYPTLDKMHAAFIKNWNELVSVTDTVYYLGDFCFEAKKQDVLKWKSKLNGHIVLIYGNHDHKVTRKAFKPECYFELGVKIGEFDCILAHRPLYPDHWDIPVRDITNHFARKAEYEKYDFVISGHVHNARLWTGRSLNVGVDMHDFKPISEAKVLSLLEEFTL
jgi:calcineurin-like phosphoesterase family protein